MTFLSILLLVTLGGACGGFASAIAQQNVENSYKIRVPFLLDKKGEEARLIPLGCLGNILTGAAASVSIFFVIGPLFNLEPKLSKIEAPFSASNPAEVQQEQNFIIEVFNPPRDETITYIKLFSISVAAGFAGIPLMEILASKVLTQVAEKQALNKIARNLKEVNETVDEAGKNVREAGTEVAESFSQTGELILEATKETQENSHKSGKA